MRLLSIVTLALCMVSCNIERQAKPKSKIAEIQISQEQVKSSEVPKLPKRLKTSIEDHGNYINYQVNINHPTPTLCWGELSVTIVDSNETVTSKEKIYLGKVFVPANESPIFGHKIGHLASENKFISSVNIEHGVKCTDELNDELLEEAVVDSLISGNIDQLNQIAELIKDKRVLSYIKVPLYKTVNTDVNLHEIAEKLSIAFIDNTQNPEYIEWIASEDAGACTARKHPICGKINAQLSNEDSMVIGVNTCEIQLNEENKIEVCGSSKEVHDLFK